MELAVAQLGLGVDLSTVVDELWRYWEGGGFVMPPLVAATVVLWFALGWRFVILRRGTTASLRELVARATRDEAAGEGILPRAARRGVALARAPVGDVRPFLDDAFQELRDEMDRFSTLVTAIVSAAPLAGLLGTVTGMIETFASLQEMALFTQSGGVAGGISAALISTQMGLAVAIPGMLMGRVLERKQQRLVAELEELRDVIAADRRTVLEMSDPDDEGG